VGFEQIAVLKTKEVVLESIAASAQILNFRRGLAHQLAQFRHLFAHYWPKNPKANPLSVLNAGSTEPIQTDELITVTPIMSVMGIFRQ
jgi:hypothetical protein